ncbi:MAG: hypothetical protein U0X76_07635 [Bacteroidia bacterium]
MNNTMDLSPEKYRHDLAIIRETAEQVIRDFRIHGVEIVFSGNELTAWEELLAQITPVIATMYSKNRQAFMSLLYQIDISESKFRKVAETTDQEEFRNQLSEMIIRREFQKVLTRRYFSDQSKGR